MKALLIGINYFGTSSELKGCHQDIEDVRAYLANLGPVEFHIMLDDPNDLSFALPTCPTKANITAKMKELVSQCRPGNTLYVHYSGHGTYKWDRSGDERDGKDECICPVDCDTAGMLIDDELNDILVKALPTGAKLRVVFDSCHSGSALDLPVRWVAGTSCVAENKDVRALDCMFLSGCKDAQTSADASFGGRSNGALTWAYLQALRDNKKAKVKYTWRNLGELIRVKLMNEGFDQVPQLGMQKNTDLLKTVDL